jgi:citrate lyase synthetase
MLTEKIQNVTYVSMSVDEALEVIANLTNSVRLITAGRGAGKNTSTVCASEIGRTEGTTDVRYFPGLVTFAVEAHQPTGVRK